MRYAPASWTRKSHSTCERPDRVASATPIAKRGSCGFLVVRRGGRAGLGHLDQVLLHVPGAGRAALGAEAAVQADVLVLDHHALGLQRPGDVEVLRFILGRRGEASAQLLLLGVEDEADAVHRADVDAGVALDAEAIGEDGLHVAVQSALRFLPRRGDIEAELDLHLHVLDRRLDVGPWYLVARIAADFVVVAPLVDAHLLRPAGHAGGWALGDVLAAQ